MRPSPKSKQCEKYCDTNRLHHIQTKFISDLVTALVAEHVFICGRDTVSCLYWKSGACFEKNNVIHSLHMLLNLFCASHWHFCVQAPRRVSPVVWETCPGDGPPQHSVIRQTGWNGLGGNTHQVCCGRRVWLPGQSCYVTEHLDAIMSPAFSPTEWHIFPIKWYFKDHETFT